MTDLQNEIISPSSLRIYPKKKDLLTFSLDSRKPRELLGSCPPNPGENALGSENVIIVCSTDCKECDFNPAGLMCREGEKISIVKTCGSKFTVIPPIELFD